MDENNPITITNDGDRFYSPLVRSMASEEGIVGGEVLNGGGYESGCYVSPAIYEVDNSFKIVQNETFDEINTLYRGGFR